MLASTKDSLVPRVSSGRGSPALPRCLDDPACCSLCLQALLGNPSGGKKGAFWVVFLQQARNQQAQVQLHLGCFWRCSEFYNGSNIAFRSTLIHPVCVPGHGPMLRMNTTALLKGKGTKLGIKEINISIGVIYCKEVFWQDREYLVFFQIFLYTLNQVPESFHNLWVPFHILSVSAGAIVTGLSSKSCYCLYPSVLSFPRATGS